MQLPVLKGCSDEDHDEFGPSAWTASSLRMVVSYDDTSDCSSCTVNELTTMIAISAGGSMLTKPGGDETKLEVVEALFATTSIPVDKSAIPK